MRMVTGRTILKQFVLLLCFIVLIPYSQTISQTVDDPVGDIPDDDPAYLDMKKIKFHQSKDMILIDFYPNDVIPKGNQGGITTATIFEVYMDVDNDSTTGITMGDIV